MTARPHSPIQTPSQSRVTIIGHSQNCFHLLLLPILDRPFLLNHSETLEIHAFQLLRPPYRDLGVRQLSQNLRPQNLKKNRYYYVC